MAGLSGPVLFYLPLHSSLTPQARLRLRAPTPTFRLRGLLPTLLQEGEDRRR